MAKVKAPLMSFDARGQIAKSLVYLGWKGLKTVRQYVIPANPKTQAQQDQRGDFGDAVGFWHTDGYSVGDVTAWNLLALSLKEALSGFNVFIRLRVKSLIQATHFWFPIHGVAVTPVSEVQFDVDALTEENHTGILYIGTTKSNMVNEKTAAWGGDRYTFEVSALSKSTKYYFYIAHTEALYDGRTGIYEYTTPAA